MRNFKLQTQNSRKPPKSRCSAFTLIEIVISVSLMAMILGAAYLCLNAAISGQKLIEPRAEVLQTARVAMATLSADLRSACPLSKDFEFLGMHRMLDDVEADNLDFATHNYIPRRPREGDYCQMSYFVEREGQSGRVSLWRRRNPTIGIDPLSGGTRELIARGLRGVRFEYYDGFDWYDTWGEVRDSRKEKSSTPLAPNLSGMPEAVRATLWFDPHPQAGTNAPPAGTVVEPPLAFQTVVRLNLAGASQSGFSTESSGTEAVDNTGQALEGAARGQRK
jgi:prepilin-type N-terminal cleavage/methylation domain-containing protein